jgi:thiamine pyrophosphokinase
MRAIIIAGGDAGADEDWQQWPREGDLIIGADGGAAQAAARGLLPDVVIGDLDSLPGEDRAFLEAQGCRFVVHPWAKDETDLELALRFAAEQGPQEIVILGALGGRLDHLLANVLLLAMPQVEGVPVRIVGGDQEALLVQGGEIATIQGLVGDLVSLLPLGGDARGVTTTGLAWALARDTLRFGSSRGVSNEMTAARACIEVEEGYVLVVHGPAVWGRSEHEDQILDL